MDILKNHVLKSDIIFVMLVLKEVMKLKLVLLDKDTKLRQAWDDCL